MEKEIWWKRGRRLGKGSFGVVSLAEAYGLYEHGCSNTPPFFMAAKSAQLSISHSLRKETKLLQRNSLCPYIIHCFGDQVSIENGEEYYNIMLEYASGGSLADRLKSFGGRGLCKYEVRKYTKNVLMGLSHMHRQGYVHCDIKPHNILIVGSEENLEEIAKIADLGLATKAGKETGSKLRGTPMYMAPESVRHQEYQPHSDIWAIGCTVLELITGKKPWDCEPDADPCALLFLIGWGMGLPEIPSWVSKEAKDFLGKCLVHDPKSRWSADMLLSHPFVSSIDSATVVVEQKRTTVFASERSTTCDSSQGSNSLSIIPFKKRRRGLIDIQQPDAQSFCKKRRTMEEVQGAHQQTEITAVYNPQDPSNASLEWFL